MVTDPYAELGVSRDAGKEEIKKAYRKLAKQYHPDLHPNDATAAAKMNDINQAYDMINNPEKYRRAQQSYNRGYGYGGQGGGYGQDGGYGQGNGYGQGGSYGQGSAQNGGYGQGGAQNGGYGQGGYGYDYQDIWVMFDDLFGYGNRTDGEHTWTYEQQKARDEARAEYKRQASGAMIIVKVFRFFLIIMILNLLLKSCASTMGGSMPGYMNPSGTTPGYQNGYYQGGNVQGGNTTGESTWGENGRGANSQDGNAQDGNAQGGYSPGFQSSGWQRLFGPDIQGGSSK